MADKSIDQLNAADKIYATDLFILQQSGSAKKLTGQVLLNWLTAAADGHGGIQSIEKLSTDGLVDTYRTTLADTTTFDFVVNNGRGITGISKTSTSGLADTYTISYNDGTTGKFIVNNGAKGDKGDNAYVWIKYASQEPTESSHSMGDIPDVWIGIYSGNASTAPTDWKQYKWFKHKGEKGDTGSPATLVTRSVTYQVSDSGNIIPSGEWGSSIPVVPQGKYLWTKTEMQFNTGDPIVSYSVSRMGIDGTGSVSSVAGVSPDATGNVNLTADDVGAAPVDHTHTPESIGAADAVHAHMVKDISDLTVTAEEINRLSGVSGNVQDQIDNVTAAISTKVNSSEKGAAGGVATLDGKGKVTANQASSSIVWIEANTTLTANHLGKFFTVSSESAITITIPNSSDIPVGSEVEIYHHGAGAVYVQSEAGCYVSFDGKSTASRKLTIPRYGAIGMKKVTAATWKVSGEAEG